jgi:hypothetical protein
VLENEVLLRRIFRVYRNALVEKIRVRMIARFGDEAGNEIGKLFAKKDDNGVTRWELLKKNAELARASPEVATEVNDDFEILGVADFFAIFEKFYDVILAPSLSRDAEIKKEHKAGLLRCMRQIKVMRDPNSHEVTQDVGRDEFLLTASNAVVVLKACDCDDDANEVRDILVEATTAKPIYSVAVISDDTLGDDTAAMLIRRLSASGIKVTQYSASYVHSAGGEPVPAPHLPSQANIIPVLPKVPDVGSPAALMLAGAAKTKNVVPFITSECDLSTWPALAQAIGITTTARVVMHPEYIPPALSRLCDRLQSEAPSAPRPEFSSSVPVAHAVIDGQLKVRLNDQLRQPELQKVYLVSPFASNVSEWNVHLRNLTTLLGELQQRGVSVTLITRPPTRSEGFASKKQFLGELARNGIRVLLHEYLHAKIYLFEASAGRLRWFVGSHNLTVSGLDRWKEVSMEGFREAEYRQAETAMIKIRDHRLTQPFDIWAAQDAMQSRSFT